MKHTFLLLFCLWFAVLHVSSQDFQGGILAGLTASQIDGDTQAGYNKAGLTLGGYIQRPFSDSVSAQMEIRLTQKGAYSKRSGYRISINYLDVPLLGQYKKWGITFEAGIIPAILVSAKVVDGASIEHDVDAFKKIACELAAGLSYQVFEKVGVNARFNYSVLAVNSISNSFQTKNQYNNWLQFAAYFKLK